ncbi:NAD(P)-dependent oxidoreductase [Streptomyces sp. NPDC048417]|uniref:NAD-dependent epimerase/dehydratase family protein n=1 Tax=Streptomyces sp. NPDC048417 TaxID=3155387 RepID=UPI003431C635
MSRYERPSVVVLGAGGFLGGHVCEAFTAADADVLGIVRSSTDGSAAVPFVRLDVGRAPYGQLADLLRSRAADVVVNAAGAVWHVNEDELRHSNVVLPRRLLEVLCSLERRPRLVHLGSVQEYGPGVAGVALREDCPPTPVNAYGRSKLLATEAVLRATEEGWLDGVVLRVANVCGPRAPRGSLLGMIAAHLALVARRAPGEPPVPPLRLSPLRARRDFIDVRDVADAVVAAARAGFGPVPPRERLLNIGRGEASGVRAVVARLIELSGLDASVIEEDEELVSRADTEWHKVDIGLARRLLRWQPRRPLEQSLRDLLVTPP